MPVNRGTFLFFNKKNTAESLVKISGKRQVCVLCCAVYIYVKGRGGGGGGGEKPVCLTNVSNHDSFQLVNLFLDFTQLIWFVI